MPKKTFGKKAAVKRKASLNPKPQGPVRIGEIIPQIMARYGFQRRLEIETIREIWYETVEAILTEPLAKLTLPGRVRGGILEVNVKNSVLVQELSFFESEIIEKLKEKLPQSKIRKIRFVV